MYQRIHTFERTITIVWNGGVNQVIIQFFEDTYLTQSIYSGYDEIRQFRRGSIYKKACRYELLPRRSKRSTLEKTGASEKENRATEARYKYFVSHMSCLLSDLLFV